MCSVAFTLLKWDWDMQLSGHSCNYREKVCWYYRTLVQHEKAATFLDILKSFSVCQEMLPLFRAEL